MFGLEHVSGVCFWVCFGVCMPRGMFRSAGLLTLDERDVVGECVEVCIKVCIGGLKHAPFHEFLTPV